MEGSTEFVAVSDVGHASDTDIGIDNRRMNMPKSTFVITVIAVAIAGLGLGSPAQARHHQYHRHSHRSHGNCLRFNKTTGTIAGAVGGGLLGNAVIGGTGGTVVGAAAGGVAGHELAHNRRKRCR